MKDTLTRLRDHLKRRQGQSRIVVWAHNSHLGDARATEMSRRGEHNLGQLARQHYGDQCYSIGFSTYTGTVTAASDWNAQAERKYVRPGLPESYERMFHALGKPRCAVDLHREQVAILREPRLQRAIGVIYRPGTERQSHYFYTRLPDQFDTLIHIDVTAALEPLDLTAVWQEGEDAVPDTFPFAE